MMSRAQIKFLVALMTAFIIQKDGEQLMGGEKGGNSAAETCRTGCRDPANVLACHVHRALLP